MTVFSMLASLLLAAGCAAEPGTGPAGQTNKEAYSSLSKEEAGSIRLSGEGIRTTGPDGVVLPFSSERETVEAAVTTALGEPQARVSNGECGAGPIEMTVYLSGVTLNFQNGYLVGWFVRAPTDPHRATTPEGIRAGSSIADARKVYAMEAIPESTLGREFATDEGIGLFLNGESDDSEIQSLYAGTNCFFR